MGGTLKKPTGSPEAQRHLVVAMDELAPLERQRRRRRRSGGRPRRGSDDGAAHCRSSHGAGQRSNARHDSHQQSKLRNPKSNLPVQMCVQETWEQKHYSSNWVSGLRVLTIGCWDTTHGVARECEGKSGRGKRQPTATGQAHDGWIRDERLGHFPFFGGFSAGFLFFFFFFGWDWYIFIDCEDESWRSLMDVGIGRESAIAGMAWVVIHVAGSLLLGGETQWARRFVGGEPKWRLILWGWHLSYSFWGHVALGYLWLPIIGKNSCYQGFFYEFWSVVFYAILATIALISQYSEDEWNGWKWRNGWNFGD